MASAVAVIESAGRQPTLSRRPKSAKPWPGLLLDGTWVTVPRYSVVSERASEDAHAFVASSTRQMATLLT
jgi:hypothetical protein